MRTGCRRRAIPCTAGFGDEIETPGLPQPMNFDKRQERRTVTGSSQTMNLHESVVGGPITELRDDDGLLGNQA